MRGALPPDGFSGEAASPSPAAMGAYIAHFEREMRAHMDAWRRAKRDTPP